MPRGRHPKTAVAIQPVPQVPEPAQEQEALSGLYIFGTVIDRTRRTINTKGNTTVEIVTYTIQDADGRRYYVDEYSPEEYYELGECAEVPVYVKTFKKRTGEIGDSFCVQNQGGPHGASTFYFKMRFDKYVRAFSFSYPHSYPTNQRALARLSQLI